MQIQIGGETLVVESRVCLSDHLALLGPPSRALYASKQCRCAECYGCDRQYRRARSKATAYGTWAPFVPVGPVREHLRLLRLAGSTMAEIAQEAGVSGHAISTIIYPRRSTGALTTQVRRATADALLGVTHRMLTPTKINCVATSRRLQMLVAAGWPMQLLALRLELRADHLWDLSHRRGRVNTSTAAAVQALYAALHKTAPVAGKDAASAAIARARTAARSNGWA